MEFLLDNSLLIFGISMVGVFGALILLVVGFAMWRAEQRAKNGEPAPTPTEPAPNRPNPLAQAGQWWQGVRQRLPAPTPTDPNHVEVARLLRDRLTGQLIVQVEGQRYDHPASATDPRHQRALDMLAHDWAVWWQNAPVMSGRIVGAGAEPAATPPASTAPAPTAPAPTAPALAPAPPAPPPPAPADEDVAATLNTLPPVKHEERPLALPSMNLVQQFQKVRTLSTPVEPAKAVAEQIDDILQQLIAGTPFAARMLSVHTGPDSAAVFSADGHNFTSLNDVTDPAVQKVFRRAVQEWENRHYRTS